MIVRLLCMGLFFVKWALSAVGVLSLLVLAALAVPLQRPPELPSISRARATVDLSSLPAVDRFQARDGSWLGYRHYRRGGHAHRAGRDRDPWLIRLQRRHHPRAVAGPCRARCRGLCGRPARPRRLRHARRHRLSRPARGRSRRLRRGAAQVRADGADHAGRSFLGRRLCAARGVLADPEPVRAHRAARALSRLRRADHAAEFRRLGQGRHPAHCRAGGAAQRRNQLLRCHAGARLRGACEFGDAADRDLHRPADAQQRGARLAPRLRRRDASRSLSSPAPTTS